MLVPAWVEAEAKAGGTAAGGTAACGVVRSRLVVAGSELAIKPAPSLPLCLPSQVDEYVHAAPGDDDHSSGGSGGGGSGGDPAAPMRRGASGRRVLARSYELGPGCVAGSTDFYLSRPHSTRAVCRSAVARVLRVSRAGAPASAWAQAAVGLAETARLLLPLWQGLA